MLRRVVFGLMGKFTLARQKKRINTMKKENDIILKDVKRLVSNWETRIDDVSLDKNVLKDALSRITTTQANTEACSTRITNLMGEIESQRLSYRKLFEQNTLVDSTINKLKIESSKSMHDCKNLMKEIEDKLQSIITTYANEFSQTHQDMVEIKQSISSFFQSKSLCRCMFFVKRVFKSVNKLSRCSFVS